MPVHGRRGSEDWQVMNYGLGGAIGVHGDVDQDQHPLGPRLATYMVYLSSVTGGRTGCTSRGLAVEPVEGDALFWFNIRSDGGFDSRIFHTGCPVLWGDKWIANKWVRWSGQAGRYPCHRDRGAHYRPFTNKLKL